MVVSVGFAWIVQFLTLAVTVFLLLLAWQYGELKASLHKQNTAFQQGIGFLAFILPVLQLRLTKPTGGSICYLILVAVLGCVAHYGSIIISKMNSH